MNIKSYIYNHHLEDNLNIKNVPGEDLMTGQPLLMLAHDSQSFTVVRLQLVPFPRLSIPHPHSQGLYNQSPVEQDVGLTAGSSVVGVITGLCWIAKGR